MGFLEFFNELQVFGGRWWWWSYWWRWKMSIKWCDWWEWKSDVHGRDLLVGGCYIWCIRCTRRWNLRLRWVKVMRFECVKVLRFECKVERYEVWVLVGWKQHHLLRLALVVLFNVHSKEIMKVMDLVYLITEILPFRGNVDLIIWWKWMKFECVVGIEVWFLTNVIWMLKGFIEGGLRLRCVVWDKGGSLVNMVGFVKWFNGMIWKVWKLWLTKGLFGGNGWNVGT